MNEITSITLETEMDLMLANKQCMKLAELTGLPLSAQTTFATAVSEISRCAVDEPDKASLTLFISNKTEREKYIIAIVKDEKEFITIRSEGYMYARRLVPIQISTTEQGTQVELCYRLPETARIDDIVTEKLQIQLNTDPSISPYEEIKRKNRQLLDMAERLRTSEQQYRDLAETLPILIYTVDKNGKILYGNKWLEKYTGNTIEELNETKWQNILHPEEFKQVWDIWQQGDKEKSILSERRLKNKDTGEYRWHTGGATRIENGDSAHHWNIYMVDIEAQKSIERTLQDNIELKETQRKLEEKIEELNRSNQQLEQFAYIASHDLQEPLRKISFYSDYLQTKYRDKFGDEGTYFFDNMIMSTERMKTLIHDILAYSTIDMARDAMDSVDLNIILAQAMQDLEIVINIKKAQITCETLPVIDGNAMQLRQLFENLLSNSIKYTEEGKPPVIHIDATVENGNVLLKFTDNGIGFEIVYLNRIFDLFQRLHAKDKYGGTGIGLAICKKIVQNHQGTITATSEPGKGAVFMVTLPLTQ